MEEIKGSKFVIRHWKADDEIDLQQHANNYNVSKYLRDRFPYPYTMNDALDWVNYMKGRKDDFNFAITINDKVIGGIGLELREDIYRKTPLLGYWLGEQFWGTGIMTEAVRLVADYAFNNLDIMSIQATVFSNNLKSMRVLEKVGFIKQGILKQCIIKNNEVFDEHIYAVFRNL